MELTGERILHAGLRRTWDALNDPAVLQRCIPGCESLTAAGEGEFQMALALRLGPVAARFGGTLRLHDVFEPNAYSIAFSGNGGAAGFGRGSAQVRLHETAEGTVLRYSVDARVGGRLAQIGSRLIDAGAQKLAEDFFAAFQAQIGPQAPSSPPPPTQRLGARIRAWFAKRLRFWA